MLGRLWPRFALEAVFLVAVAVGAGLLHLSTAAIVTVMLVAYLATVVVEWTASRVGTTSEPIAVFELESEPEPEPEPEPDATEDAEEPQEAEEAEEAPSVPPPDSEG